MSKVQTKRDTAGKLLPGTRVLVETDDGPLGAVVLAHLADVVTWDANGEPVDNGYDVLPDIYADHPDAPASIFLAFDFGREDDSGIWIEAGEVLDRAMFEFMQAAGIGFDSRDYL